MRRKTWSVVVVAVSVMSAAAAMTAGCPGDHEFRWVSDPTWNAECTPELCITRGDVTTCVECTLLKSGDVDSLIEGGGPKSCERAELVRFVANPDMPPKPVRCGGVDVGDVAGDGDGGGPDAGLDVAEPDVVADSDAVNVPDEAVGDVGCTEDCDLKDTVCADYACVAGTCEATPVAGTCDDGNPCTHDDVCDAGDCAGTAYTCTPAAECEISECDGLGECTTSAKPGTCKAVAPSGDTICYLPGELFGFSGQTFCYICEGDSTSAQFKPAPDGTGCNKACVLSATCQEGACVGTSVADGAQCDDGDLCTQNDTCLAGECEADLKDCADGNSCTADTCDGGFLGSGACQSVSKNSSSVPLGGYDDAQIYYIYNAGTKVTWLKNTVELGPEAVSIVATSTTIKVGPAGAEITVAPIGAQDATLVSFANAGPPVIRQLGALGWDTRVGASAGGSGQLILSGTASAEVDFGTPSVPESVPGISTFVAGYGYGLVPKFAVRPSNPEPAALAASGSSHRAAVVSTTGIDWPSATGSMVVPGGGDNTAYLVALDVNGLATSASVIAAGPDPTMTVVKLAIDAATSNVFVAGTFGNPIQVGAGELKQASPAPVATDGFVAKFVEGGEKGTT